MIVLDRQTTVVALSVPWSEHSDVYELYRFVRAGLASDGVAVDDRSRISWSEPAELVLTVEASEADALAAVRRAVQDAPVRVASVDVINDDGGA